MNRKIDHIVYATKDLDEGMSYIQWALGIKPQFGGYHADQGTKNAVLNFGNGCYLEIITVDHDNQNVNAPRWMGVDLLSSSKITRWALKSDDLARDSSILKNYNSEMGVLHGGQRAMSDGNLLTWEMTLPLPSPEVEIIPFMTDWQKSDFHPTDRLTQNCELVELIVSHPTPESVQPIFD